MSRLYYPFSVVSAVFFLCFCAALPASAQSFAQDFLKTTKLPQNTITSRPDCGAVEHVTTYAERIRVLAFGVGEEFEVRTSVLNCANKDLTAGFHIRYHLVAGGVGPIDDFDFTRTVLLLPRAGSFKLGRKVGEGRILRTTRTMRWDSQASGRFRLVACPAKFASDAKTIGVRRSSRRCGIIALLDVQGPPRIDVSLREGTVSGTYPYWTHVRPRMKIENHGNATPQGAGNKITFTMRAEAKNTGGQTAAAKRSFIRTWTLPNGLRLVPGLSTIVPNTAAATLKPVRLGNGKVAQLMQYKITAKAAFTNDSSARNNITVATVNAAPNGACEAALYWTPNSITKTVRLGTAPGALQFDMANTGRTACKPFELVVRRRRGQEGSSTFSAWSELPSSTGTSNTVVSVGAIAPLGFVRVVFRDRAILNQRGLYQYALFPRGLGPDSRTWNHSGAANALAIPVR